MLTARRRHTIMTTSAIGSPQQQHRQTNGSIQVAGMSCVLCGGPFRPPTAADRLTSSLTEPSASFRWLCQWQALPAAAADKRRRGEPTAFFCHKACCALLTHKLRIQPQHSHIWPFVKQQMAVGDSMPDAMTPVSYLGMANVLDAAGWTHTAATMLSPNFAASDRWMLHSPLACTSNASRILKIWQPKLDRRPLSLAQQMSLLLLSPSAAFKVRVLQDSPAGACDQSVQECNEGRHGRSFLRSNTGTGCPVNISCRLPAHAHPAHLVEAQQGQQTRQGQKQAQHSQMCSAS